MARRDDFDSRETVSIFNLSFLDVFACALGALVLILLMIFNQVSITFDTESIKEQIEEIEGKTAGVVGQVRENVEAEKDARDWDAVKEEVEANTAELSAELAELRARAKTYANLTTDTVTQAQQAVAQMQSQTVRQRKSVSGIWFGTGSISQKARFVEVYEDYLVDYGGGQRKTIQAGDVDDFVKGLMQIREQQYPLFIVRPAGIYFWVRVEALVENAGIPYGFEPYTNVWAPILAGGAP